MIPDNEIDLLMESIELCMGVMLSEKVQKQIDAVRGVNDWFDFDNVELYDGCIMETCYRNIKHSCTELVYVGVKKDNSEIFRCYYEPETKADNYITGSINPGWVFLDMELAKSNDNIRISIDGSGETKQRVKTSFDDCDAAMFQASLLGDECIGAEQVHRLFSLREKLPDGSSVNFITDCYISTFEGVNPFMRARMIEQKYI